jgi:hypothetical protein
MHRRTATLAVAALTTVGSAFALAPSAYAGGGHDHGDDHGDDHGHHGGHRGGGFLHLTDSAADTLDSYDVDIAAIGGGRGGFHRHGGDDHGSRSFGIAFVGDDAASKWKDLDWEDGSLTATVDGAADTVVLVLDTDTASRHGGDDDHGDDSRGTLELTAAGAASIDKAAGADAFDAGDDFATVGGRGGGDCRFR